MNFETEYKNIIFNITLEKEDIKDLSLLMGDKFNRLPNEVMIDIKKGTLASYNLIITSSQNNEVFTHYFSGIMLTPKQDELLEELQEYLESESVLDSIAEILKKYFIEPGPIWRVKI